MMRLFFISKTAYSEALLVYSYTLGRGINVSINKNVHFELLRVTRNLLRAAREFLRATRH